MLIRTSESHVVVSTFVDGIHGREEKIQTAFERKCCGVAYSLLRGTPKSQKILDRWDFTRIFPPGGVVLSREDEPVLFAKILSFWILAATAFVGWRRRFYGKETQSPRVIPPTYSRGAY